MAEKYISISKMFIHQFFIIFIILLLLSGSVFGNNINKDLRKIISDPGDIPDFHDFHSPTIIPGSTGSLKFTITNRYDLKDMEVFSTFLKKSNITLTDTTILNVTLIINIYLYTTLEEKEDVQDLSHSPKIVGGNSAFRSTTNQWTAEFFWPEIRENESVPVELKVKSFSESPQGTYFVRMHLNFVFSNTSFDMKSRGHFTDAQWDRASENITTEEGLDDNNENLTMGRLNLDKLGVDGIIPDTSIRIKEPIPQWPLYVLIGLAVFFVIMAVVFYYMDEKGKFPRAKQKLDDIGERVKNIRYRRR